MALAAVLALVVAKWSRRTPVVIGDAEGALKNVGGGVNTVDAFVSIASFHPGRSLVLAPGTSAWDVVGDGLARTVPLVITAVLLAAAVAVAFAAAVARAGDDGRSLLRAVDWGCRSLPAFGWLYLMFVAVTTGILPASWASYPAPGPFGVLPAAVALAIPIGTVAGSALVRRQDGERSRFRTSDLWLRGSWFVGALVVVETLFGVSGISAYWLEAVSTHDAPVFAASTAILAFPALLGGALRDGIETGRDDGGGEADPTEDGRASLVGRVREDRLTRVGLVGVVVALVAGAVGSVMFSAARPTGPSYVGSMLTAVGSVTLASLIAAAVAGAVGAGLEAVGERDRTAGALLRTVLAPATNVPLVVLGLLGLLLLGLPSGPLAVVGIGVLAGVALAPLVVGEAGRAVPARSDASSGSPASVAGVLAGGAAVVALAVADLAVLGLWTTPVRRALWMQGPPLEFLLGTVAVVSVPAMAFYAIGTGLESTST